MGFLKRLFGGDKAQNSPKQTKAPQQAESQADVKRIFLRSSAHPAHKLAVEADALDGERRVEVINTALALSPQDADLLFAKVCALDDEGEDVTEQLAQLAKLYPGHFDAVMKKGKHFGFYNRPLPEDWEGVFEFPSWSENRSELNGLMLDRLRKERHAQIVRYCLSPSLAMVYGCDDKIITDNIKRMRWELRWARLPYGTIAVHYLIWIDARNESHRNEAFLPHGVSNPPSALDGYCLLQRLAQSHHCFLVFSDGDGNVLRNELFEFPESLKRTLKDVKIHLDKSGPCNPKELIDKAGKWYMDNTDIKSITF